jgi:hypothetical protein
MKSASCAWLDLQGHFIINEIRDEGIIIGWMSLNHFLLTLNNTAQHK